ncbi:MIZ zinc finger family protein [Histomonas meleagridis]|uniref:MIZ zinc finger family protein n=1 Tax=Histomonas meleagridis TaxID=135588 RepID=UPI003559D73F|nr:MIZ zinc finger family protein [Histomonas meleagridis]KAH0796415.1 MIZ zinc finger family protein [Histomonas meleagridis]
MNPNEPQISTSSALPPNKEGLEPNCQVPTQWNHPNSRFTVINISSKRKSNQKKKGTAFFTPKSDSRKTHSKWFKEATVESIEAHHLQRAMSMDILQIQFLCQLFNVFPQDHANFQNFLLSIKATDHELANSVHQAMKIIDNCHDANSFPSVEQVRLQIQRANSSPQTPTTSPIQPYFESDFRYNSIEILSAIVVKGAIDNTITIPNDLEPFGRIIIQCIPNQIQPLAWPQSIKIIINGTILLSNINVRSDFIDITQFNAKTVRIVCEVRAAGLYLYIKKSKYESYDQIVDRIIQTSAIPNENLNKDEICIFDPLSGQVMQHPGRGIRCMHKQCFDLKQYLIKTNLTKNPMCPICMGKVPLNELAHSRETEAYISQMLQKNIFSFDASEEHFSDEFDGNLYDLE